MACIDELSLSLPKICLSEIDPAPRPLSSEPRPDDLVAALVPALSPAD
jgi:hypothetical protein